MRPHICCLAMVASLLSPIGAAGAGTPLADTRDPATVRENGWFLSAAHYVPRDSFNERFRDIDVTMLTVGRAWRFGLGLEVQAIGSAVLARGSTAEPFATEPPRDSDAEGIALGGGLRWTLLEWAGLSAFAEGSVRFLWTLGTPFPAGGTGVNGFTAWGGGLGYDVGPDLRLEATYHRTHISNGGGIVSWNPAWNGEGVALTLRYRFG